MVIHQYRILRSLATTDEFKPRVPLREITAWILVAILTSLFTGSLIINTILALWIYRRWTRGTDAHSSAAEYEMKGNPCYETPRVKQMTDSELQEMHVYEMVQRNRTNYK